jgi:hypothetical protein
LFRIVSCVFGIIFKKYYTRSLKLKKLFGLGYGSFNSLQTFTEYKSGLKNRKAFYIQAAGVFHKANGLCQWWQMVFVSGGKWSLSVVANGLCQWWQMVFVSGGKRSLSVRTKLDLSD